MGRQIRIPGTEDAVDADLARLGAAFAKSGSKHKKAGEAKKADLEKLVAAMLKKKVQVYRDLEADPPISINLSDPKYTVKVKTIQNPDSAEDAATQPAGKA